MSKRKLAILIALVAGWLPTIAYARVTVTVEEAGAQETSVKLSYLTFESFDTLKPTDYKGLTAKFGGGKVSGSYDIVGVREAGESGGAGGEGNYLSVDKAATLTLTDFPANYFGLWASAINGGETISFYRKEQLLDEIVLGKLGLTEKYYGNPTKIFAGTEPKEAFAFINFFVRGGYDSVLLSQADGRFESDTHTIGVYDESAIIPEPATWMTMALGLAMVGIRRRRKDGIFNSVIPCRSTSQLP